MLFIGNFCVLTFSDEAWFQLHEHTSSQNNLYWSYVNPHLVHKIPPHDPKVGMWCAMNIKLLGPYSTRKQF
jgi:hypothetical protein